MAKNFSNLRKETDIQIKESQRLPVKNPKAHTPRYTIIRRVKVKNKETILTEAREKQVICKGNPIRLPTNFEAVTLWTRREWQDIFKILK